MIQRQRGGEGIVHAVKEHRLIIAPTHARRGTGIAGTVGVGLALQAHGVLEAPAAGRFVERQAQRCRGREVELLHFLGVQRAFVHHQLVDLALVSQRRILVVQTQQTLRVTRELGVKCGETVVRSIIKDLTTAVGRRPAAVQLVVVGVRRAAATLVESRIVIMIIFPHAQGTAIVEDLGMIDVVPLAIAAVVVEFIFVVNLLSIPGHTDFGLAWTVFLIFYFKFIDVEASLSAGPPQKDRCIHEPGVLRRRLPQSLRFDLLVIHVDINLVT